LLDLFDGPAAPAMSRLIETGKLTGRRKKAKAAEGKKMIAALGHHLLESTVFALAVALLRLFAMPYG
jgi:hypothetical protein